MENSNSHNIPSEEVDIVTPQDGMVSQQRVRGNLNVGDPKANWGHFAGSSTRVNVTQSNPRTAYLLSCCFLSVFWLLTLFLFILKLWFFAVCFLVATVMTTKKVWRSFRKKLKKSAGNVSASPQETRQILQDTARQMKDKETYVCKTTFTETNLKLNFKSEVTVCGFCILLITLIGCMIRIPVGIVMGILATIVIVVFHYLVKFLIKLINKK